MSVRTLLAGGSRSPATATTRHSMADTVGDTPVVELDRLFHDLPVTVFAKLEFLNPFGSTKDRVARYVIERWLADGKIVKGGHLVESSSGNFAIALAALAPLYDLTVTCVVDPNTCGPNLAILRGLGARVEMVDEPDVNDGYLHSRLERVREVLDEVPGSVCVNQYANELCWRAHYDSTAHEIVRQIDGPVDTLVVAVSTTATLLGISRRLRERWPALHTVAVDAKGSVIFGGAPGPRRLPGLGSSRTPELLCREEIDEVRYVQEQDAVSGCRDLLHSEGILAGASSGAVVSAIHAIAGDLPAGSRVLTVFPDRGERYIDLVYDPAVGAEP
ncbi:2,3-diaminopropionate biosynthesis protein SbnA [Streptomyces griseoflavus]|uniref:2,3-diaminopropionate biosynthesis protein SbnA n=1 Tax=Streptomyces griseoflavus TaxID=35619 RepID=UPI0033F7D88C